METKLTILIACILHLCGFSQDIPSPSKPQSEKITIRGGTIHIGNGKVIENGLICFENGKFTFVQSVSTIKTDETLGKIIDATGKHIYPGLIALNTNIGLSEIEAVRSTNDVYENGSLNSNARAAIAYNTDSRVTPTIRSNGVLYAQIAPRGGRISGTSSVVQLDAWNWEDAVVKENDGVFVNWPSMYNTKGWWAEPEGSEANKEYQKQLDDFKNYLREAKSYCFAKSEKKNLRFESLKGLFDGTEKMYVNVDFTQEILHVIQLGEELGIRMVIVGGRDAYQIADVLAQKNIPVILSPPHSLPATSDGDIKQPYKTPFMLQKAGVLFAISIGGFWQERNLPFQAGTAVAYGLSKEEALSAITFNTAKILNIDSKIGTIEQGKNATLIISSGDILDMKTSNVEKAFIDGREVDLNNKQKELNKKFMNKYGLN